MKGTNPVPTTKATTVGATAAVALLGSVVAANYVTHTYGVVPIGFGLATTAGTYFAAAALVLRDAIHRTLGRWVAFGAVIAGAALSGFTSAAALALASGVTFLIAESADLLVYDRLQRKGLALAVFASGVVGAVIDTYLFLHLAGFPLTPENVIGQITVKIGMSAIAGLVIALVRRRG